MNTDRQFNRGKIELEIVYRFFFGIYLTCSKFAPLFKRIFLLLARSSSG